MAELDNVYQVTRVSASTGAVALFTATIIVHYCGGQQLQYLLEAEG